MNVSSRAKLAGRSKGDGHLPRSVLITGRGAATALVRDVIGTVTGPFSVDGDGVTPETRARPQVIPLVPKGDTVATVVRSLATEATATVTSGIALPTVVHQNPTTVATSATLGANSGTMGTASATSGRVTITKGAMSAGAARRTPAVQTFYVSAGLSAVGALRLRIRLRICRMFFAASVFFPIAAKRMSSPPLETT